jgi:aspartyl-tRNA(Asn)/glutamyl-tRNA(Gln) amidotransferase subunit B
MTTDPAGAEEIRITVSSLISRNQDKVSQAKEKPALMGWFVGQTMKALSGNASPEQVNVIVTEEFAKV